MSAECGCDFDPAYHREFNDRRNRAGDSRCHNEPEPNVGLCTPCLFGCAP